LKVHILSYYSLFHRYKVQGPGVISSIDNNEKTSIRPKIKVALEVEGSNPVDNVNNSSAGFWKRVVIIFK